MKNVTSADRHASFLKSLVTFSKDHRAAQWSGSFGAFLETIFPNDARGITRVSPLPPMPPPVRGVANAITRVMRLVSIGAYLRDTLSPRLAC